MLNDLKPLSAIGMPYHGLAVNNKLTTLTDGDITVTGDGGAVVFRHPGAPFATRNTAQQALDAAKGWEWRDYALLCGTQRAINGGPQLATHEWLMADADGTVYVMYVVCVPSAADVAVQVWRGPPFGRFGRDYSALTDTLIGTETVTITLPDDYTGGLTATQVAAGASCAYASCIVPDPTGRSVFLHLLADSDVFVATSAGSFVGANGGSVYAIIEVALSGAGESIACSFPNTDLYVPDLVFEETADVVYGEATNTLYPDFYDHSQTVEESPHPVPPTEAGIQYTETSTCVGNYSGFSNEWGTVGARDRNYRATVYRCAYGDAVVTDKYVVNSVNRDTWNSGTWQRIRTYESYFADPGYAYQLISDVATCTRFYSQFRRTFGEGVGRIQFGSIDEGVAWSFAGYEEEGFSPPLGTGGSWCADYRSLDPTYSVPASIIYPEELYYSEGDPISTDQLVGAAVETVVNIYPGMLMMIVKWHPPGTVANQLIFRYRLVGVGETAPVLAYSLDLSSLVDPPPFNQRPYRFSFQPVSGDSAVYLGTEATAAQYV